MEANYLARSAANHALWRLLNDPGFPASETVYYMHNLANGRYGYKVRKPSLTTFGTVATVGAIGDVVSKQSYVQYLKPYDRKNLCYYLRVEPFPRSGKLIISFRDITNPCHQALHPTAETQPDPTATSDRATRQGAARGPQIEPHRRSSRVWQDDFGRRVALQQEQGHLIPACCLALSG